MELLDQKLRLHYIIPGDDRVRTSIDVFTDEASWWVWLNYMVEENPGTIWFFTVASTDIWETERHEMDEWAKYKGKLINDPHEP